MIIVGAVGVIAGLALADRFGVFILLPATLLAMAGTILFEVTIEHTLAQAWLGALCIALGLQLGFIAGGFFRGFLIRTTPNIPRLDLPHIKREVTAPSEPASRPEADAWPKET